MPQNAFKPAGSNASREELFSALLKQNRYPYSGGLVETIYVHNPVWGTTVIGPEGLWLLRQLEALANEALGDVELV